MVVNSRYNPFTYEELVKPLADYNTAYEKQEAALEKLATDAGAVEAFINEENAPKSWGVYTQFRDQLKNQADELATKGLSAKLRKDILNTGTSYRSNVSPIVAAINRRQEAIKEFNNSPAGKSSNYIGQKPSDTSVDDWLGGNTPQVFGVNGNDISDYVKAEVQAASERNYQLFSRSGYNVTKMGASQEETAALIKALRTGGMFDNNTAQGQYLNSILDDLRTNVIRNAQTAFGFENFLAFDADNNPIMTADASKFMDSVYHGIMSGMKGSEKQETNQYALANHNHNLRMQEAAYDAMLKSGQYTVGPDGKLVPVQTPPNAGEAMREHIGEYRGEKSLEHQRYIDPQKGLASAIALDKNNNPRPVTMPDGETFTNMLEVYRHYNELTKELNSLSQSAPNARDINPNNAEAIAEARKVGQRRNELKAIIAEYDKTFGNRMMSNGDYRKMKNLYGFTDDDFTLSDVYQKAASDRAYSTYNYSTFTIADEGGSPDLLKDIHSDIVSEINRRGNNNAGIRKTTNGIDDAGRLSNEEMSRLKDAISNIYTSPENLLSADQSYVVVQVPKGKQTAKGPAPESFTVLVPTYYLPASVVNYVNKFRTIYGNYIGVPISPDRGGLNSAVNSLSANIRTSYNTTIPGGRLTEGTTNKQR